jgi:NAD(P)-dependent dehydrogenase (short-subunit alcohol dehydrogenase family)
MKNIIVITGASSGFGALAARALAMAGHTVYASMRETTGRRWPALSRHPPILRGVFASHIHADHAVNQARINAHYGPAPSRSPQSRLEADAAYHLFFTRRWSQRECHLG